MEINKASLFVNNQPIQGKEAPPQKSAACEPPWQGDSSNIKGTSPKSTIEKSAFPATGPPQNPREYISSVTAKIEPADVKKSGKVAGPPPRVGTKRSFWRWDFTEMPPGFKQIDATCRAAGDKGYIFVEDASWGKEVNEADLNKLQETFEKKTPSSSLYPGKGIYDIDTELFGNIPDAIDNDPKPYLFVTNLGNYNGMGFDGYFNAFDQMPDQVAWDKYQQHSNEVEMLYLNCGSKTTPIASDYMLAVTSHELQHLIHFNYDMGEESWINESLSEAAMTATGFFTDKKHLEHYADNPASPLVVKDFVDYGACLLWGTYMMEQLGPDFFQPLVANTSVGSVSITDTLQNLHRPENFRSLFDQWVVANFAASRGVTDPRYSYKSFPVPPMKVAAEFDDYPMEFESTLKGSGVDYVALKNTDGKNHRLFMKVKEPRDADSKDYGVQLMRFNGKELTVEALDLKKDEPTEVRGGGELYLAFYGLGDKDFSYSFYVEQG